MTSYPSHPTGVRSISTARLTAATVAGRLAGAASRIARRGTGRPSKAEVMLKLDPSALRNCLYEANRAGVRHEWQDHNHTPAGRQVRESLNYDAHRLVHNADGANLHHGLTSALSRKPQADLAILETDERVVADMIRLGRPELLVLLNFSRDQLDRHHEIKGLGHSWRQAGRRRPGWTGRHRQCRRAPDRLGSIGCEASHLGRHGYDLDPGLLALSDMRRQPGRTQPDHKSKR